jgi:arylsulfatase A-like enzyme
VVDQTRTNASTLIGATILLLALPTLAVHAWMAVAFPSYLHGSFGQDLVFAFAWCGLLVLAVRWRLLGILSIPVVLLVYLVWLFLVLGEAVSYYLQADTFNARFFAHLNPVNLRAGLHAFPVMIGGGVAVFGVMLVVCAGVLAWLWRDGRREGATLLRSGPVLVTLVIALLAVLGVDSAPRRLTAYVTRVRQSAHFADTPQGRAVAAQLDLHPVPPKRVIAAPGKNLVFIYMESLERQFWSSKLYPGLTPNLDRLRAQGIDFSGFETFSGANYTIAGMFASQCGVPLFSSAFAGLDAVATNTTDAQTFHPKIACLGDVLHKAGYTQLYMGGAPIHFSNKGLFFRLHGYDQALGLQQLEAANDGKLPQAGWGLYDSALFKLALARYQALEATRKPFNLTLLTLDTHPPNGRPSPGCPKYAANSNSMLQAVHCTDFLLGRFVDALSREPGWKNTIVVIMSDHLMMRSVADPLFPPDYHRRPALLVLNAGHGERPARMYHMDIAPTLLALLGVRTNATFIAGDDRSAPGAAASSLVDDAVTDAVLRKALWSRENEFELCKKDTLVRRTSDGGFDMGGRELGMSLLGRPAVGVYGGQSLDFFVDNANAKLVIVDHDQQAAALAARGDASVLTITAPHDGERSPALFSVDWLGRHGARAHIADVPSLTGLEISAEHCGDLIGQVDRAPENTRMDLSHAFEVATAQPLELPGSGIDFTTPGAAAYGAGYGWLPPAGWGSWAIGPAATMEFRVPARLCGPGATLKMRVDPYLPPSRPDLDVGVWVNGKRAATWHFDAHGQFSSNTFGDSDNHRVEEVEAPLDTGGTCDARVEMRFVRPDSPPPPYPKAEDPRPLQLLVRGARVGSQGE